MLMKFTALIAAGLASIGALMLNSGAWQATANPASDGTRQLGRHITQGALLARSFEGKLTLECPLKHTDVQAEISGPVARVTLTQDFENTATDKIEAVYVFPLPHNAAIDEMTLTIGNRVITGQIKRKQEAQAIYQAARNAGNVAALLDQERPNIFIQSVANIAPGAKVRVTIRYIEQLTYEAGQYSFTFPMVVGPRYNPSTVTDAERITPPVAPPDQRGGHDISLAVNLNAGLPIVHLDSQSHQIATEQHSASQQTIRLKDQNTIPNKDFVLRYSVAGKQIADAVLAHKSGTDGYFALMLQPPARVNTSEIMPKEITFVLDTSGSMHGFPLEKAKESIRQALSKLNARDTFNLITFSGDTRILFSAPVSPTPENLRKANEFLNSHTGSGGTEMMKAIHAALDPTDVTDHVPIVCFMTDGFVGNEDEIIAEVKKHSKARVFSFGIGSSVNRYLLDQMAEAGRGEVEYVSLTDDGSAAANRFEERIRNPILTDISVEFIGMETADVIPAHIPDLFAAKPVVLTGRYTRGAKGVVKLTGKLSGNKLFQRDIPVEFPENNPINPTLAKLWARAKVNSLQYDHSAAEQVTQLGLNYKILTPFTSFVAVEETTVTEGGVARKVQVPVELPEGVSYEGIYGEHPSARVAGFFQQGMQRTPIRATGVVGGFVAVPQVIMPKPHKQQATADKLDPALLQLKGTVKVRLVLARTDDEVRNQLRQNGVEFLSIRPANTIVARVDSSKLQELAKLDAVLWIGPAD